MIWKKKENRFSTPYKRYLFAICISDIAQSSALLFGPLAVPRDASVHFFLAKGNMYSCTADGIAFITGASGVPFYMVALCFSYLYKIKFNMSDKKFLEKYDRFIHAFVITYCVAICTGVALTKNIYGASLSFLFLVHITKRKSLGFHFSRPCVLLHRRASLSFPFLIITSCALNFIGHFSYRIRSLLLSA